MRGMILSLAWFTSSLNESLMVLRGGGREEEEVVLLIMEVTFVLADSNLLMPRCMREEFNF